MYIYFLRKLLSGSVVFVVKGKLTRFNSFDILNRDELVYEKCTVK